MTSKRDPSVLTKLRAGETVFVNDADKRLRVKPVQDTQEGPLEGTRVLVASYVHPPWYIAHVVSVSGDRYHLTSAPGHYRYTPKRKVVGVVAEEFERR